jgi:glycosyltransferase involved in cell wall biosynthesis
MERFYSFVIPVYNRPEETRELLESLAAQVYPGPFEVVIVEDGSSRTSEAVVSQFRDRLQLAYFWKENTGPGDSRNYGMKKATGTYFILVDSDCLLPPGYLKAVDEALENDYADCFGGPDDAHPSFNALQQAISYTMTSVLTTGGIRGGRVARRNFQPRSFNMGLSREAFLASGGFGNIHPGEDPDLSLRLKKMGFSLRLIDGATVYHKRRITLRSFYRQVFRFGLARPVLNRWHPGSSRLVYWFPTLFLGGLAGALLLPVFRVAPLAWLPLALAFAYLLAVGAGAGWKARSLTAAALAPVALLVQFWGYGLGFLKSTILLTFSKKKPEELLPRLFFKT